MRLLITGATGFIGRHVVAAATASGHHVAQASRSNGLDLANPPALAALVGAARPDAVIHLAGFANVGWSHREPATAIAVNTAGTAALLTAVAEQAPRARVVLASTSEVYARSAEPLAEDAATAPESPYGQSKLWMEASAGYFHDRHGLSVGVIRSFAHCGAGQGPAFALSNFARQVAEARLAGHDRCEVRTGNKATVRDFSDVRDAARAYLLMAACEEPGPVNIGSGVGRTTADVVAAAGAAAGVTVDHQENPELIRPGENPRIVADVRAAARLLGWQPEFTLEQAAAAAVDWWTAELQRDPSHGTGVYG